MAPSLRRNDTTAVKNAIRRTETEAEQAADAVPLRPACSGAGTLSTPENAGTLAVPGGHTQAESADALRDGGPGGGEREREGSG
jgi:hypothetical protein